MKEFRCSNGFFLRISLVGIDGDWKTRREKLEEVIEGLRALVKGKIGIEIRPAAGVSSQIEVFCDDSFGEAFWWDIIGEVMELLRGLAGKGAK